MFEYAVSAGEGTLLDYGMGKDYDIHVALDCLTQSNWDGGTLYEETNESTVIVGPALPGCTTGQ